MIDGFEQYLGDLEFGDVESTYGTPAESTVRKRERSLEQFSEWLAERGVTDVEDITRRDILLYVDYLTEEGYKESTIKNGKWSSVSAAITHLYKDGAIDDDPLARVTTGTIASRIEDSLTTRQKKRRSNDGPKDHLKKEQVYQLAENYVPDPTDRNELLVKLLFWTGLRISEALHIEIGEDGRLDGPKSDVYPDTPKIEIYREKTNQGGVVSYPSAELNPLLYDWVRNGRLRYKCADSERALFIGRKGRLTKSRAVKIVKEAAEEMGIQDTKTEARDGRKYHRVTPHLLRHSHAMHMVNVEGVPLDAVKDHLGHANVETTERFYAEGTEERIISTFGE
ncbi:tyrosine-type recombinase/integrase [Halobellus inordinatus]|uniref:tyrosine-type recombinase/integrase n=1 Tax=Halobellus inordinatus TaxID=1126236 RepID=UPI0021147EF9|nr:tyrosine-type recombinase/integrase [Halobellus ramosii]